MITGWTIITNRTKSQLKQRTPKLWLLLSCLSSKLYWISARSNPIQDSKTRTNINVYLDFMTIKLYGRNQTMCQKEERQILRYYKILNYEPDISLNRIRALIVMNQIQRETNHCLLQIMDVGEGGGRKCQKC